LKVREDGIYVDATFGGGGHSREILKKLGPSGVLIGFDQDPDAWEQAPEDGRLRRVQANFRFLKQYVRYHGHREVDGVLADLGVSSHQFDTGERGFSTRYEGPLDMRMDQDGELTAEAVVNRYEEDELYRVLARFGELPNARRIASAICEGRTRGQLRSTEDLKRLLQGLLQRGRENKLLAQIFQALRIEVNRELEVLEEFLQQSAEVIREEGRLVVISYHSLEDRMVKRFVRDGRFDGREAEKDLYGRTAVPFRRLGGAIRPSDAEVETNPRSRSAILRVAVRNPLNT